MFGSFGYSQPRFSKGDVVTPRISVQDGASLEGNVQVSAVEQRIDDSQPAKAKQASA